MDVSIDVSKRTVVAILILCACLWPGPNLHAQWTGAARDNANNLTVMIDAYFRGIAVPEWGTGIIVARRDRTLYIATAKHILVRGELSNIQVALRWLNAQSGDHPEMVAATLAVPLASLDPETDVAVLKVELATAAVPSPDALLFSVLADPALLKTGDSVRPVGHANGQLWNTCVTPDTITAKSNRGLTVDSKCTAGGDSGGPLFDEYWHIGGMIVADQENAFVPLIDPILALLRKWKIPVDLAHVNAPQLNEFLNVSAGIDVACGVTRSNRAYCWGKNEEYALGAGTEAKIEVNVGLPAAGAHLFSTVSAGAGGACGLTLGNTVLCWGTNSSGQLGNGTTDPSDHPVAVGGEHKFASISSGPFHVCGLTLDGAAYCWGYNRHGQLGNETTTDSPIPTPVSSTLRWRQISAGGSATCAISDDHEVYCWGGGPSMVLKPDPGDAPNVPQHILAGMKFSQVSVGGGGHLCVHGCDDAPTLACGVTIGGDGYCWGNWPLSWAPGTPATSPLRILPTLRFTSIISGQHHACGIAQASGQTYCWGANEWNEAGELPQGKARGMNVGAQPIANLANTLSLGLGDDFSCALRLDRRIVCWGKTDGPLGMGDRYIGDYFSLSAPTFPVRLSHCTDRSLPAPPTLLTHQQLLGFGSIVEKVEEIQKKGLLPKDPPGLEPIVDVLRRVDADLQIVRGKIRACEMSPTDPIVSALLNLAEIESKLEAVVEELWFGPIPGPFWEKPNAAQKAEMAAARVAEEGKIASAVSAFQDLVRQYRDAESVPALRDVRP